MKVIELESTPLPSLRQIARDLNVQNFNRLKKEDLILQIQQAEAEREGLELRGGILEIMSEGIGFLRSGHYQPGPYDVYVSQSQIRRYGLRNGDLVIEKISDGTKIDPVWGFQWISFKGIVKLSDIDKDIASR